MSAVESVVKLLLQKLSDQFFQEALFLRGVRDQVEWLEAEFRRMRCFLKDADARQDGDERVKNWLRDVRDVAYDAEDIIDNFTFKIASLRSVGCIRRCVFFCFELIALYKVGSEIERIKNKIHTISESRSTYGIENIGQGAGTSSAGLSLQEWRLTSPNVEEPDFVGFEKEFEALAVRLTGGELRRCVVSVVGMGGLGKTTLTKRLYNTDSVKNHFHNHAWISVSQGYSARDLLQVIVRRWSVLSYRVVETMDIAEVRDKISEYLKHKRYLVVLDDIWTKEAWDALKDAFPDMNNGSRVILTTRNKDVALHADAQSHPHELPFLNKEEGWVLFCKKTFPGRDGRCPRELKELGSKIVGKCHGLPLAIVVIGGLLSSKEPREWENVHKSISWQFVKGEVRIFGILSLSYKDLPYYLKPCFLYLGKFPEDYEFHTKKLIQMWAAEGLLEERGEETLEEVGEDYLKELIQRSMVQVASRSSSRGIKSCRIHDLLRDLSISEAKEGLFLEIQHGNANVATASRARRHAAHFNAPGAYISTHISLSFSTPRLRSMLIYAQGYAWIGRKRGKFLFSAFKLLRVLYLHGIKIKELPREIGELIHLRYFGCTNTHLKSLPSSIGNLPNLQTLSVESLDNIKVPSTIEKMKQLRHLQVKTIKRAGNFFRWGEIEGHPRLELISNLQTLSLVKAGKWMDGCLGNLTNLRKLGIVLGAEGRVYEEVFYESIVKLDCLHTLRLSDKLQKLPESTEFPTKLTNLTLSYSYLEHDPLATLEKLKNLRILRLLRKSYLGKEMACSSQGFPRLEYLQLRLLDVEEWRLEEGSMPSLLHLRIASCWVLKKLPDGLQHVTTLSKLEVWWMPNEFQKRLQKDRGEDWHKIRHIPSVVVRNNREKYEEHLFPPEGCLCETSYPSSFLFTY